MGYSQILDLDKQNVLVEDYEGKYFDVAYLPQILTLGKHYFTISIKDDGVSQYYLRDQSQVLFEFKDSEGQVIYSDVTNIDHISGTAVCYVWVKVNPERRFYNRIYDGIGTLTILGILDGVSDDWNNKYNVKYQIPIEIRKEYPNKSPLLFQSSSILQTSASKTASYGGNSSLIFSESLDIDTNTNEKNYKRSYMNVNLNHLDTFGGRVGSIELYVREGTVSKHSNQDFKLISRYNLTSSTDFITQSDHNISQSFNGINPSSYKFKVPQPTDLRRYQRHYYKLKFLNPASEYARNMDTGQDLEITSSNISYTGSALILDTDDNFISSSAKLLFGDTPENSIEMQYNKIARTIAFVSKSGGTSRTFMTIGGTTGNVRLGTDGPNTAYISAKRLDANVFDGESAGSADSNTFIDFGTADTIEFEAGGELLMRITEVGTAIEDDTTRIELNPDNKADFRFRVHGSSGNNNVLYTTATKVYAKDLRVNGDLEVTGAITSSIITSSIIYSSGSNIFGDAITDTHTFNGNITASGNISSSGGVSVFGQVVHLEGTDPRLKLKAKGANHPGVEWHEDSTRKWVLYNDPDESDKLVFKNDSTELVKIDQAGGTEFTSHITASGKISASGNIEGDSIRSNGNKVARYRADESRIRFGNANTAAIITGSMLTLGEHPKYHVTASGEISASGDIIGNSIWASSYYVDGIEYINSYVNPSRVQFGNALVETNLIGGTANASDNQYLHISRSNIGIGTIEPPNTLTVAGDISASNNLFVGASSTDDVVATFSHNKSGSLFEVKASAESGSIVLSGSLLIKDNHPKPAISQSKLYASGSEKTLYWSGDNHVPNYPIYPKQRRYYNHNFFDDINTSVIQIPWFDSAEGTNFGPYGVYGNLFICNARLLKVFVRSSGWTGTATIQMGLSSSLGGSSTITGIGYQTGSVVTGNDYDVLFFDWENNLQGGSNQITAGSNVALTIKASADVTNNHHWNICSVWELDYSTELTASIIG